MARVWNEFNAAMRVLVGTGPVKHRLLEAYSHHLAHLREEDLPEALRDRFVTLNAAMREAGPTHGLTAASASVRKMSERDAIDRAADIFEMFVMIAAESASVPGLRVDTRNADDFMHDMLEVPSFLSRA